VDSEDPGFTVTTTEGDLWENGAIIREAELALIEGILPAIIKEMLRRCEDDAEE
jgi:hypothetical protein